MGYADGYPMRLVGGRLALDFVNTADWSIEGEILHEKLEGPEDLVCWLDGVGLDRIVERLEMDDLRAFRRDLRQRFVDPAERSRTLPGLKLSDGDPPGLVDVMLISAHAILLDPRERARLKLCASETCGWLFIDESRGARRQWCSMETCGNRAKARRHYRRTRGTGDSQG